MLCTNCVGGLPGPRTPEPGDTPVLLGSRPMGGNRGSTLCVPLPAQLDSRVKLLSHGCETSVFPSTLWATKGEKFPVLRARFGGGLSKVHSSLADRHR